MSTKITIICENTIKSSKLLLAEHGLSMLIENEDTTLYDTGQGFGILHNIDTLNIDINKLNRIILSHGHYDHTDGLLPVLENCNHTIPVLLHKDALNKKIASEGHGASLYQKYIGMSQNRERYESAGAEFNFVSGFQKLTENISVISEIKRPLGWKAWDTRLKCESNGSIIDDPFLDDLSLLLNTDSGPVVLLGCAHAGIIEILDDISENTGFSEFHAVIGGTHLMNASEEYINKSIDTLKEYKVKIISPMHCTSFDVQCRFATEFKNEFFDAGAGTVFEF